MPLMSFDFGTRDICGLSIGQTGIWVKEIPLLPNCNASLGHPLLSGFGSGDGTRMYRSIEMCPSDVDYGKDGCDACCDDSLPVCPIGYVHTIKYYNATTGVEVTTPPTVFTPEIASGGGSSPPAEIQFNTVILRQADAATWDIATAGFVTSVSVLAESSLTSVNGVVMLPTASSLNYSTNSDYGALNSLTVVNAALITYTVRV